MKTLFTNLFAISLLVVFTGGSALAQTVAVGHATAEVVESVSASSLAVTFLSLNAGTASSTSEMTNKQNSVSAPLTTNYDNLNLGQIKINSGSDYVCNVIVNPAVVRDNKGNDIMLETSASNNTTDIQSVTGNSTLTLTGRVRLAQDQQSGTYSGSYKMVFAYN